MKRRPTTIWIQWHLQPYYSVSLLTLLKNSSLLLVSCNCRFLELWLLLIKTTDIFRYGIDLLKMDNSFVHFKEKRLYSLLLHRYYFIIILKLVIWCWWIWTPTTNSSIDSSSNIHLTWSIIVIFNLHTVPKYFPIAEY